MTLRQSSIFIVLFFIIFLQETEGQTVHDASLSISTLALISPNQDRPVQLSELPNGNLVYSTLDGEIYEIIDGLPKKIFDDKDHGLPYVSGMEVKGENMYICGSVVQSNDIQMIGYVIKGHIPSGEWTILAQSDPYYLGRSFNDHRFSALIVGLNEEFVYVHSGTRTNSGEVHELDDVSATVGLRDGPLRGKLFKIPTSVDATINLPNDSTEIANSPYLYIEGLRHLFAMAWGTDGQFYGGSNSDRRDVGEAFYKLEEGKHYGFPWWIGGKQNPIQFPDYNPNTDLLLPSGANNQGYYDNDPDFPPMPQNIDFVQPYKNIGPDADKVRNPETGNVYDASDAGETVTTFSGHRSPTGLLFDRMQVLQEPFTGDAFMVSYTNNSRLLQDDGHDLLHIALVGGDTLSARRLISGFIHPIDVVLKDGKLFILEMGNSNGSGRRIYEVTFDESTSTKELSEHSFKLFPNPVTEQLWLDLPENQQIQEIRIYDQTGKTHQLYQEAKRSINLQELPPQVYYVEVLFKNGGLSVRPFVKVK